MLSSVVMVDENNFKGLSCVVDEMIKVDVSSQDDCAIDAENLRTEEEAFSVIP